MKGKELVKKIVTPIAKVGLVGIICGTSGYVGYMSHDKYSPKIKVYEENTHKWIEEDEFGRYFHIEGEMYKYEPKKTMEMPNLLSENYK